MSETQLATVTAAGRVKIDGATTDHAAIFPTSVYWTPAGVGSRVLVEQIGSQVYVTEVLTGTTPIDWGLANIVGQLSSGWSGYGAGFQDPAIRRIGNTVQLSGLLGRPGPAAGAGNVIYIFPVGWRPLSGNLIFPTIMTNGAGAEFAGRLDVSAAGALSIATSGCATGGYVSLSPVRFDV